MKQSTTNPHTDEGPQVKQRKIRSGKGIVILSDSQKGELMGKTMQRAQT